MDNNRQSRPGAQQNRQRPQKQGNAPGNSGRSTPPRKKKKKKNNVIPAIVLGVLGVVVIALIIMGLKAIFSGEPKEEENVSSSILDVAITPKPTPVPEPTAVPTPEPAKEADIEGLDVTEYSDMVIVGSSAYDYYKFDQTKADSFAEALNKSIGSIGADVNIYSMIIPGATEIMLPLSFLNERADKTSDQAKAIKYINSKLDPRIKSSELYPTLKAHCDESIYFKSDNHWTSLGAYYAYGRWAQEKGITVPALTDYEKTSVDGFLGNHYVYTGHEALSTPETMDVYKPKASLTMGDGDVFADVSEDDANLKFNVFLGGSKDYIKITNGNKDDGSSCVIVMDSNGTAITPFIAENYQYTYAVDYRLYEDGLSAVMEESKAKDVIYCISIVASLSDSLIEGINAL